MCTARAAAVTVAEDLPKARRRQITRDLREAGDAAAAAAEQDARCVLISAVLAVDTYEALRRDRQLDTKIAAQVEKPRLVRQFGHESLDVDFIARDTNQQLTRRTRNAVRLRLAREGHWRTLDRLRLGSRAWIHWGRGVRLRMQEVISA